MNKIEAVIYAAAGLVLAAGVLAFGGADCLALSVAGVVCALGCGTLAAFFWSR